MTYGKIYELVYNYHHLLVEGMAIVLMEGTFWLAN